MRYNILTATQAAAMIHHGEVVGFSGFSNAGSPKVMPAAIAKHAEQEHAQGREWKISLMAGAAMSTLVDGVLSAAGALERIMPFQSSSETRQAVNACKQQYVESHISMMAAAMRRGHLPRVTTVVVEVCDVTDDGVLTLTTSEGNTPTFCMMADRIILELNSYHDADKLRCLHDVYVPMDSPAGPHVSLKHVSERIGTSTLKVDPEKIVGVVMTHEPAHIPPFKATSGVTDMIGDNLVRFLEAEYRAGRIPREGLPFQSGVGNVANAVLSKVGQSEVLPPFQMYTEVLQDKVVELMKQGRCAFASSTCLYVSDEVMSYIYKHFDYFRDKIILRPQEVSNDLGVIRRLGVISMNTAIEADIFGNINSSHLFASKVMNGIGGSGDYARAARYTIFSCPSTAKMGAISAIVPMVSHTDHTEHDVDVIVTEQGVADLRGKSPRERAECIIENCAHPDYRDLLRRYVALTPLGQTPHHLGKAFAFHMAYQETGDMRNAKLD